MSGHRAVMAALEVVNDRVPAIDPLRATVGDELQGVYATLGEAIGASYLLRRALRGDVDLRFGFGGGEVQIIDASRGIQDGSAWWRAREAVEAVEALAALPGHASLRTGVIDGRDEANSLAQSALHLVDAHLGRLRLGALEALDALLDGLDNQAAAALAGISPSANSQRVKNNDLRVLAEAMESLERIP